MSTADPDAGKKAAPAPFTEEEVASVAAPPEGDAELADVAPAEIDDKGGEEPETPFDKLAQRSRRLSPERVRTVVQSLLFVADRPLALEQLYEATGIDRERLKEALEKLAGMHREGVSGIVLQEVGGGWQLRTDPGSAEYVRRFLKVKPQRLTRAAVETLAIIAYRQPVTRPEVEDIRGVDSGAVIKALLERRLVKILGKKEEVGRPILYGTSREFLEFFALRDLSSLPTLREFQELSKEHQEIVEKETPSEPRPSAKGTVDELSDPTFRRRLEDANQDSEAALAELETAIATADERAKTAAKVLNPPVPPASTPTPGGEGG
ncbi:MAG TPA: SMC-Scp complex subunit ScpB [Myxococcales bacterium]|nr:SMC-Scp complex subunit ScpB [Myxococcales bacterium]